MPHVQARDGAQKPKLKALGYRIIEIWSHRSEEGLNELASDWTGWICLSKGTS
jgi:hypothetical protein